MTSDAPSRAIGHLVATPTFVEGQPKDLLGHFVPKHLGVAQPHSAVAEQPDAAGVKVVEAQRVALFFGLKPGPQTEHRFARLSALKARCGTALRALYPRPKRRKTKNSHEEPSTTHMITLAFDDGAD